MNRGKAGIDALTVQVALALFVVSMALLAVRWPFSLAGVSDAGAQRILAGQIPYRDFWTLYAPGSFYLLALLLKIFGKQVLVGVIGGSVLTAAAVSTCYLLVFDWLRRPVPALVCAALLFAACFANPYFMHLGPYPPTLLLILLVLFVFGRYCVQGSLKLLFGAGLLLGLLICFKHDVGGYTGLSTAAGLAVWHMLAGDRPRPVRLRELISALAVYTAGACVLAVPVALWFAMQAGMDMWQDLIRFPLTDFRYARPEHYPSLLPVGLADPWRLQMLFNIFRYLIFLLAATTVPAALAGILFAVSGGHRRAAALLVTCLCAWCFHFLSAHTQINTNIISMTLYGSLTWALLYWLLTPESRRMRARLFGVTLLSVAGIWCVALVAQPVYMLARTWRTDTVTVTELPHARGMRVTPHVAAELTFMEDYLNSHPETRPYVYIGLHRHDVTIISRAGLYFVLDRQNPTRHDQLHPGVADRADYQRQIIADLERKNVSVLFLNHMFNDNTLDRVKRKLVEHLPLSCSTLLDGYIRQHYVMVDRLGRVEIWHRREDG